VLLVLSTTSSIALADDAFVHHDGSGLGIDISSNLATHLTNASYNTTVGSAGLPILDGFKQVWDARFSNATPLTGGEQSSYLSYLQGGGTLFLMGENSSFATRNNSVIAFIAAAGGGTLTFASPLGHQTVQGSIATTPNNVPTVDYLGAGAFTNAGTGTCITKDSGDKCTAIAFGAGRLANASHGALISVLDVNFLQGSAGANFSAFVDNLIAYLAVQSAIGASGGFVPISNQVTRGVATVLDDLAVAPSVDAGMAQAIGALGNLPAGLQPDALGRLTPAANSALFRLGSNAMDAGLSSVAGRLEGVRNAGILGWTETSNRNTVVAAAGPVTGLLEPVPWRDGVWGKIFGGDTRQGAAEGYAGYKAATWGLTLGADRRLSEGTVLGGAFTYAATNLNQRDFMSGSGNDLQSFQATAYASHDFGPWYLEAMLAYAKQRYRSHRETGLTGVAKADYDGDMWGTRIVAGKPYAISETLVTTPFVSLEYTHLRQDGYRENGAGPLDLTVGSTAADRARSGVGIALAGETQWGRVKVRPSIRIQWLHDFIDNGINTTASFAGGGAAFVTPGQKLPKDSGAVGGSLMFAVSRNAAVSILYDYEGANGYRNETARILAQVWF